MYKALKDHLNAEKGGSMDQKVELLVNQIGMEAILHGLINGVRELRRNRNRNEKYLMILERDLSVAYDNYLERYGNEDEPYRV